MSLIRRVMWCGLAAVLFVPPAARAVDDYSSAVSAKIALESAFETRVMGVLSRLLSAEDVRRVIVLVTIEPNTEKSEIERETWTPEKGAGRTAPRVTAPPERRSGFALPGVPLKQKIGETPAAAGGGPSFFGGSRSVEKILKSPESFIKRLSVTLLVDENLADDAVDMVKRSTADLLKIDAARGDTLTVRKQPFNLGPAAPSRKVFTLKRLAWAGAFASGFLLLGMIGMFVFGPLRAFLSGTLAILRELKETKTARRPGAAGGEGAGGVPAGMMAPTDGGVPGSLMMRERMRERPRRGEEKEKRPFDFIQEEDLKRLSLLLEREQVEVAALVVSYLTPEQAARVMPSLPPELQTQVARNLSQVRQMSGALVAQIEADIKSKINFVVGGTEYLVGILDRVNRETRDKIFTALEAEDGDLAKRLRELVFTFEDLLALDDRALQTVLREVNVASLAIALRGAAPALMEKVLQKMSEGAAAMLREEIDLGRPVSHVRVEQEQRAVVDVVKRLEEEGRLTVKRGAQAAPPPPTPAPLARPAIPRGVVPTGRPVVPPRIMRPPGKA